MSSSPKIKNLSMQFANEAKASETFILKSLKRMMLLAQRKNDEEMTKCITEQIAFIEEQFLKLEQKARSLENSYLNNNYLLEYKQKDLLVQTDLLEDALEEISIRNEELLAQKLTISEQAEKLRLSHQEILEKNMALETQTESLLDQAEYLNEANKTIMEMHDEVYRQKREIEEKSEELMVLNQEKNNLIGIVAHDLKSPLNQVKGLLIIIKKASSSMDAMTLNCIDMVEKSTERLREMINKILDVEAIESKQLNLKIEKVNISSVMENLVERYILSSEQKQIGIITKIEPNVFVNVDEGFVEQVFENILSNALKFSPSFRNVYVTLQVDESNSIVEIKDEGPGLSEEDKSKLFSKYQKLSARPTGNETSTGLGLSIVKKFVDAMDGKIWCTSEVGNGASFFVTFPRNKEIGL